MKSSSSQIYINVALSAFQKSAKYISKGVPTLGVWSRHFPCKYFSSFLSVALTWLQFSSLVPGPRARFPAAPCPPGIRTEAAPHWAGSCVLQALTCLRNRKHTAGLRVCSLHLTSPPPPFLPHVGHPCGGQTVGIKGGSSEPALWGGVRPGKVSDPHGAPEGTAGPLPSEWCLPFSLSPLDTPLMEMGSASPWSSLQTLVPTPLQGHSFPLSPTWPGQAALRSPRWVQSLLPPPPPPRASPQPCSLLPP